MTFGAPTDAVSSAYFGTTQGKFRMVYPFNEQATIMTDEVRLTDESTGQSSVYKVVAVGNPQRAFREALSRGGQRRPHPGSEPAAFKESPNTAHIARNRRAYACGPA